MKTIFTLVAVALLALAGCATSDSGCSITRWQATSEFSPKVPGETGDQILFSLKFKAGCPAPDQKQAVENVLKEYAKKHGYSSFRIVQELPVKFEFQHECIVVFD